MDSDSDDDMPTNNVFTFRNMNMTVCAKGPNMINRTNLSLHNHIPASIMHRPRNMQHSTYASSVYDQRSVHSGREVSPMSVRSAYDFQPRNFNMSQYPRGMSSQRSVMNGRSGSPMSITSTTSNVTAVDFVKALNNNQFNKHDLKIISDAYKKFQKRNIRKKFEKRRNLRLFLKGARRKSGGESGELGSDSSVSDDDCQSNRSSISRGNVSSYRSTRTDLSIIRRTMQDSNIYKDCSANFKQTSFKNMFSIDSGYLNPNLTNKTQYRPFQKDRFKSGFLLPSQRFNKSVVVSTIPENVEKQQRNKIQNSTKENFCIEDKRSKNFMSTTDSEHDEIFAESSVRQKQLDTEPQRKRILEKDEETHMPHKKKHKLSPIKNISGHILNGNRNSDVSDNNKDDFVFAKPSFPIKKISNLKIKEKIIATSPNINSILGKNHLQEQNDVPTIQHTSVHKQNHSKEILEVTRHSDTDVSMRPSFIKRKLFTQKLDVAENKILSSDENSPKTVYGGIQKEKNKARKLVTNQSCLSRDVLQDDNYLDLIHKIVPPDQMNTTNQPNQNSIERISKDVDDKLEASSIILTCNNDDISDTYTDEDIFNDNNNTKNIINKDKKTTNIPKVSESRQDCKVVLERDPTLKNMQLKNGIKNNPKQKVPSSLPNVNKSNIKNCVKSFWDTDLESDFECHDTIKRINCPNEQQVKGNNFRAADMPAKKVNQPKQSVTVADISLLNSTTATVHKFNNTSLSVRSHRVSKKRKCCEELEPNSSLNQTQHKKPKSKDLSCLSYTMFANNVKTNNETKSVPENKTKNSRSIRSCRTPKQNSKDAVTNEKINNNTEARRSFRIRKANLSNATLDEKATTKSKSKKQNGNSNKQSNNKDTEKTKAVVNSRKSDVSFSLNIDMKAVKTKKVTNKNTDSANNSKERKPRQSNVSFSILSESPLTRSKAANMSNEKQKSKRSNTKHNNNDSKDILEVKRIVKTPNKRNGKNGIINMVQNLKDHKSKSVRKR